MDGAQILLEQKNIRGRKKRGRTEGEEKWNLQVIWKNHCSILQKKEKRKKERKEKFLLILQCSAQLQPPPESLLSPPRLDRVSLLASTAPELPHHYVLKLPVDLFVTPNKIAMNQFPLFFYESWVSRRKVYRIEKMKGWRGRGGWVGWKHRKNEQKDSIQLLWLVHSHLSSSASQPANPTSPSLKTIDPKPTSGIQSGANVSCLNPSQKAGFIATEFCQLLEYQNGKGTETPAVLDASFYTWNNKGKRISQVIF